MSALGIRLTIEHSKRVKQISLTGKVAFALFLLVFILFSTAVIQWLGDSEDERQRALLLSRAHEIARTIDPADVADLGATIGDLHSPIFRKLQSQLRIQVENIPGGRYLYLMRLVDDEVRFLVDEASTIQRVTEGASISIPGEVYYEATAALLSVFSEQRALVEGPVADGWGVWVSALVPIVDPATGTMHALLGIDLAADEFRQAIWAEQLKGFGLLLVVCLLYTSPSPRD